MDLRFTAEEDAFRAEVRAFIRDNLDPVTHRKMLDGRIPTKEEVVAWQRTLNRRQWATPSWPKEAGGPGFTPVERYIFLDELHQAPAPEPVSFNVSMIGPVLIAFGTPGQKDRFLAATANNDIWWAQGFSEPGAGSDLASLRTSARREGDHFVVSGHKIWQGMAHHADWMFTLVRTDPVAQRKQMGISFLLIDLRLPGVTVRPIVTMDGRHEVNEVFLDEVRVPADCLVGTENKGWDVTKFLLSNERTGIARIGMTKHLIRRIKRLADGHVATLRKAAAIEAELKILEITQLRVLDGQRGSDAPDPRSSVLKLKGVELRQAASELLLETAGAAALEVHSDEEPFGADEEEWLGTIMPNYAILRAASIYGGSSEVQKTIVAGSILGLK
ncbi:acyl-CoA dehydrogenase family protein [Sphingobium sp. JS3065]|jgi:alkylation response protein AidB-like acyl-CoA dehydrogenase|uniref:acyl-CoA dehydrogenase family protein n=1 Tax=Sphingobium sp. JS3065 TaxID=2970925 RepID=UPI002264827C|nr:acyl-CoA dehydrogenase family protein [Sphingobium sp. JS3065]UZW57357.1 acyl-CoA dehydrogenase family protein [Sphingobium sp. JS3065]